MKTVAYLRVSTPQQDVSSQRLAILEYARKHDLHIDDFIEATASGQASLEVPDEGRPWRCRAGTVGALMRELTA